MQQYVLRCWRTAVTVPRVARRAIRTHMAVGRQAARVIWRGTMLTCVLVPLVGAVTLLPPIGGWAAPLPGPGGDPLPPPPGESLFFPPAPTLMLEPLLRDLAAPPLLAPPPPIPPGGIVGPTPLRPVPEPAGIGVMGVALATLLLVRRWARK